MAYIIRLERAPAGAWWLNFGAGGSDEFNDALSELKWRLGPERRRWHPDRRAWWIATEGDLRALSDLLPGLERRIAEAKRGPAGSSAHRWQSHAEASRSPAPQNVAAAFARLCLTPEAPVGLVAAARRYWARQLHPDAGGAHREMVRANDDADLCEQWAERQAARKVGAA